MYVAVLEAVKRLDFAAVVPLISKALEAAEEAAPEHAAGILMRAGYIRGRLGVVPRDVVNAVGGDEASDAGVGSVVIVEVEPVGVGRGACLVGEVDRGVGPLRWRWCG